MIATDVASRGTIFKKYFSKYMLQMMMMYLLYSFLGLDIPAVSLIINHTIPNNPTDYVHRIGRTARAKKEGTAISIVTQHDIARVRSIEEQIGKKFERYDVSSKHVLNNLYFMCIDLKQKRDKNSKS